MRAWEYFNREGIEFISKPDWQQAGVAVGFSARMGGVSSGAYTSLNMGLHVGDKDVLVCENRRRFLTIFGAGLDDAVCCQQVHGTAVYQVGGAERGQGARALSNAVADCDALFTDTPGVYLFSFYADCVPVYFYDPRKRVIGVAHCGWKGTMGRIAVRVLEAMSDACQTEAEDVQIFIGPGIGPCCFSIQFDLMSRVNAEFGGFRDIITGDDEGLIHWDLQETNRQILIAGGIPPGNIDICCLCTSCHPEKFFSHRRDKGHTGRMGAVLGLQY